MKQVNFLISWVTKLFKKTLYCNISCFANQLVCTTCLKDYVWITHSHSSPLTGAGKKGQTRTKLKSGHMRPDRLWGPRSLLSNGYQGALSLEVKPPGHEVDHSPPSSVEVKNAWSYTSISPLRFHGMVLS
jgi:hypothetical protein